MWVIGNGESRNNININKLEGLKVGCNAIFRDYPTDYLICVDRRMMDEAIEAKANLHSLVYTRKDWFHTYNSENKRIRLVPDLPYGGMERPDDPWHWGSGPYAVLLAAKLSKEKEVNLIGFDLYGKSDKINNVYKDTKNYEAADKRAIDPRYWIYQIGKVFECYPKIKFTIYQEDGWQCPKSWKKSNIKVDNLNNLR
jgi:hypothetical protein